MNYKIAFSTERNTWIIDGRGNKEMPPYLDVVEEFEAENDDAANKYAEEHYPDKDWYVLDSNNDNING